MMDATIYDTVSADTLEDGDQILIYTDYLENIKVTDLGNVIEVRGYSDNTGDMVTYFLAPDADVDLWAV